MAERQQLPQPGRASATGGGGNKKPLRSLTEPPGLCCLQLPGLRLQLAAFGTGARERVGKELIWAGFVLRGCLASSKVKYVESGSCFVLNLWETSIASLGFSETSYWKRFVLQARATGCKLYLTGWKAVIIQFKLCCWHSVLFVVCKINKLGWMMLKNERFYKWHVFMLGTFYLLKIVWHF